MVKISSPQIVKNTKAGVDIIGLFGVKGAKTEAFDNNRMVIMNLKKGECVAIFDQNNNPWELSRDADGRLNWRKL